MSSVTVRKSRNLAPSSRYHGIMKSGLRIQIRQRRLWQMGRLVSSHQPGFGVATNNDNFRSLSSSVFLGNVSHLTARAMSGFMGINFFSILFLLPFPQGPDWNNLFSTSVTLELSRKRGGK